MGWVSPFNGFITALRTEVATKFIEELHARFNIQCSAHTRQRHAQLYQRDRHRRLHAHHYSFSVKHPCHGSNVRQHSPNERIDDLQGGDINENAGCACFRNFLREIILQLQRKAIVHINLNGDQQEVSHAQDWNTFHLLRLPICCWGNFSRLCLCADFYHRAATPLQAHCKRIRELCFCRNLSKINS